MEQGCEAYIFLANISKNINQLWQLFKVCMGKVGIYGTKQMCIHHPWDSKG